MKIKLESANWCEDNQPEGAGRPFVEIEAISFSMYRGEELSILCADSNETELNVKIAFEGEVHVERQGHQKNLSYAPNWIYPPMGQMLIEFRNQLMSGVNLYFK